MDLSLALSIKDISNICHEVDVYFSLTPLVSFFKKVRFPNTDFFIMQSVSPFFLEHCLALFFIISQSRSFGPATVEVCYNVYAGFCCSMIT